MMDADLNVSGIEGYGRDFLNRRRAGKQATPSRSGDKNDKDKHPDRTPGKPGGSSPSAPGDTLVDFLA